MPSQMYSGSDNVKSIFVGGEEVKYAYLGSTPIFPDVVKITGTSGTQSQEQFRSALTARGLNYATVEELPFLLNTGSATNLSLLFHGCAKLKRVPYMDTSKNTDMTNMFFGCASLEAVPNMDTSMVNNMSYAFSRCATLTSVPQFNTPNVGYFDSMFNGCTSIVNAPQLNMLKAVSFGSMFQGCSSLTYCPDISVGNATNADSVFQGCTSLVTPPKISGAWIQRINSTFRDCTSLRFVPQLDTPMLNSANSAFMGCTSLPRLRTPTTPANFIFRTVKNATSMFENCTSLTEVDAAFDAATNMSSTFYNCVNLKTVSVGSLANVTNVQYIFENESPTLAADQDIKLNGLGPALPTGMVLDVTRQNLTPVLANGLLTSLGTVPSGRTVTVKLPASAQGCDTSIATGKNWKVTIG